MFAYDGGIPEHIWVRRCISAAKANAAKPSGQRGLVAKQLVTDGAPVAVVAALESVSELLENKLQDSALETEIQTKTASAIFHLLDIDGNGVLSWKEIEQLTALAEHFNPENIKTLSNRKRRQGRESPEVQAAMASAKETAKVLFSILDGDSSGDITPDEVAFLAEKFKHFCLELAQIGIDGKRAASIVAM